MEPVLERNLISFADGGPWNLSTHLTSLWRVAGGIGVSAQLGIFVHGFLWDGEVSAGGCPLWSASRKWLYWVVLTSAACVFMWQVRMGNSWGETGHSRFPEPSGPGTGWRTLGTLASVVLSSGDTGPKDTGMWKWLDCKNNWEGPAGIPWLGAWNPTSPHCSGQTSTHSAITDRSAPYRWTLETCTGDFVQGLCRVTHRARLLHPQRLLRVAEDAAFMQVAQV